MTNEQDGGHASRLGPGHNARMILDVATYVHGVRHACDDFAEAVRQRREAGEGFLWIGMKEPTAQEFVRVSRELGLHELAVEDAVHGHQRPKLEIYRNALFLVTKSLSYVENTFDIESGEIMMFIGDRFVITVRREAGMPLAGVRRELEAQPDLLRHGPSVVAYAVLDKIVDGYTKIELDLERDLDRVERDVFEPQRQADVSVIYALKREVLEFRRAAVPLVEPMRRLADEDLPYLDESTRVYFRDIHDHLLRAVEHVESYDRLLSDVLSAHLAKVSVQQNTDMRKISAWVAIAAFPTMLAGIYGMNFDHMPELHSRFGYPILLAVMVTGCVLLYRGLRRADWL